MSDIVFVSRYGEGVCGPDLETMCQGQCEGMGCVPIHRDKVDEPWKSLWKAAEDKCAAEDGWHFVECPDCKGTGVRQ